MKALGYCLIFILLAACGSTDNGDFEQYLGELQDLNIL